MDALDAIPKKHAGLEETRRENGIHITRDRRKKAPFALRILIWARQTSPFHRIDIEDPVGVRVWELVDGKNSVGFIAQIIEKEFKDENHFRDAARSQVIEWTIDFLRMLYSARLIYY